MNKKSTVTQVPLNQMRKVSRRIDPKTGDVLEEIVTDPGQSKFDKLKEQRKQKLGL